MAKSGRGPSVGDLVDLAERRLPRGRTARHVVLAVSLLIALPTIFFTAIGSVVLAEAQAGQQSYDRVGFCAAGVTDSHGCVLRTNATVSSVHASKNTGKNAHGYTTKAYLQPDTGNGQSVTLDTSRDLTSQISSGERWPVLVWRNEITTFTLSGKTHDTDENPHRVVTAYLAMVSVCLVLASMFGRPVLRRWVAGQIAANPRRNRIPDWTLVALVAATIAAALLRASYVVAGFGLLGVAVLLGSAVWPFLPWVREPDPGSWLGRGPARAAQVELYGE